MLNIPQAVQNLFLSGTVHKNLRVHFPNGERGDITNENIVKESMKFNESLCSRDALKFGMSEASTIEFETVGVENILGMTIEVGLEVDTSSPTAAQIAAIQSGTYDGTLVLEADSDLGYGYYRVPLGIFGVTACPRSHGAMTHRRVIGYNTLSLLSGTPSPWSTYKFSIPSAYDTINLNERYFYENIYYGLTDAESAAVFERTDVSTTGSQINYPLKSGQYFHPIYGWDDQERQYFDLRSDGVYRGQYATLWTQSNVHYPHDNLYIVTVKGLATFRKNLKQYILDEIDKYPPLDFSGKYYYDEYNRRVVFSSNEDASEYLADLCMPPIQIGWVLNGPSRAYHDYYNLQTLAEEDFTIPISIEAQDVYIEYIYVPSYRGPGTVGTTYIPFALFDPDSPMLYKKSFAIECSMEGVEGKIYTANPTSETQIYVPEPIPIEKTGERSIYGTKYYTFIDAGPDFRPVLSGVLEVVGKFGRYTRGGSIVPHELVPADSSESEKEIPLDSVDELWWDEYDVDPIGVVIYIYKDSEAQKEYQSVINIGTGRSVYRMTNNAYLNFSVNIAKSGLTELLTTYFRPRAETIGYTPCELTMQGMPWIEAGDGLIVKTGASDVPEIETYMLQRTLTGIQHLEDKVVSVSGEITGE